MAEPNTTVPGFVTDPDRLYSDWVEYDTLIGRIRGYASSPRDGANGAGIVVIHEAFGVTPHARDITRRFANLGYHAVCPDLYSRAVMPNEDDLNDVMEKVLALPDAQVLGDLEASAALLRTRLGDDARVGCIGFCQGGRASLLFAAQSSSANAVVDCWGGMLMTANGIDATNAHRPRRAIDLASEIRCPVFAAFGADDENPSVADAHALEAKFAHSEQPTRTKVYPDAGHAFLNDTRAHRYRDAQAHELWKDATAFLAEHLGVS